MIRSFLCCLFLVSTLLTVVTIYQRKWRIEVPSFRTHGSIGLVTFFRELETLKAAEEESASYIDAFAAALHASSHDINSLYALAERVHASQRTSTESDFLYKWAMDTLALFKVPISDCCVCK
jgi:hypothetical protein